MYAFVLGPLVWVALAVCAAGTVYQVIRFYSLTREAGLSFSMPLQCQAQMVQRRPFASRLRAMLQRAKLTAIAVHPVTVTVSMLFHLCLLVVPLFLLGHNALIARALGLTLPSMPDGLSDMLTAAVLFCCAFFLLRRILLARVRAITSVYDYLVLALATLPFLSGFLAYHQMSGLDYRTLMIVHMLSGELMIMAIPFTKLTHMIFFFMNRFLIVNEHTLGKGSRTW